MAQPGAGINAKNLETGLTRTTISAEDGSYRLLALPVGATPRIIPALQAS